MANYKVEEIASYLHYGKALRLYDDKKEIIVTLDVGPRIMHVSLLGQPSVLQTDADLEEDLPDGNKWHIMGGHRVWHSPEAFPRSYMTDDKPLESYELLDDGIVMVQEEEPWTQMKKSIEIHFTEKGFHVVNRIQNNNAWPIEFAVWSLSLGAPGGREVVPATRRNTGLLPNTGYALWPYSRIDDYRIHWGRLYHVMDDVPTDESAFKFGFINETGWLAYFYADQVFVKKFKPVKGAKYPDNNVNFTTYSGYFGVELESTSPLTLVKPGKTLTLEEDWFVMESKGLPTYNEDEVAEKIKPIAEYCDLDLPNPVDEPWDPNFEPED